MVNLLLIGFGPHAKRIYYPISVKFGNEHGFRIIKAVDLIEKKQDIETYFQTKKSPPIDVLYLNDQERNCTKLTDKVVKKLDKIVAEEKIAGVIISTEPLAHICYAEWALARGLHILMDKPTSTRENVANSLDSVQGLLDDYYFLKELYTKSKSKYKNITFSLMVQRRYHPAFQKMKSLIAEIFRETNCPITSIQSFHSDGQWRMPTEIVEQHYHPYNQGYGKCSHSGYHSIDIIPWLLQSAQSDEKKPDNVDIFSSFVKPNDFLSQLTLNDYRKLFHNFDEYNHYTESELRGIYKNYGEIDAFTTMTFRKRNNALTLASINLVHNGFAQRSWVTAKGRDLYKGNGRVRHESHYVEQGPFQAISFISYQSKEVDPNNNADIYEIGGEYHLDIHVFRNDKMFPKWKNYEKYSIKDLGVSKMKGESRGHQEDARRKAVLEFVSLIRGDAKVVATSDYLDHELATLLTYGIYKSAVLKEMNKNPLVNIQI